MSPSDLKQLERPPPWVDIAREGNPTLMLFSTVDDRSGVVYEEYRCVFGEEVEAALRFLFAAMAPKPDGANPLQGIPKSILLDGGPVKKSAVFQRVMDSLGIEILPHMPAGSDGKRTTARAKGKVERPFRTIKDAHETLYHFHQPETEAEANQWLTRFIDAYNNRDHRSEPHSRADDWHANLPADGVRAMCTWERFCTFARVRLRPPTPLPSPRENLEPARHRLRASIVTRIDHSTKRLSPNRAQMLAAQSNPRNVGWGQRLHV